MVKFRQPILPHDKGRDVLATKRGMHAMGYRGLSVDRTAGKEWEHAIRVIQHKHNLEVDGIYGPKTHEIIAPHFDGFARWLYEHARIRKRNPYVNPFSSAYVEVGRIDAGVDYHGRGPIDAIGDAYIEGLGGGGWPGGEYILYRLTSGGMAGKYIYVAEGVTPTVRAGQRVKAGATICTFRWDSAPGMYPGIETGWSSNLVNLTYADATGEPSGPGRSDTEAGLCFARFLKSVGAPAPDAGVGPLFP